MMLWKCVHSLRPSSGLAVQRLLRLQQSARLQKKSPLQSLTCRGIRSDTALSGNTAVSAQLQGRSNSCRGGLFFCVLFIDEAPDSSAIPDR